MSSPDRLSNIVNDWKPSNEEPSYQDLKRENDRLKEELRIAKELILKEVYNRAISNIEKSNKDSDNG